MDLTQRSRRRGIQCVVAAVCASALALAGCSSETLRSAGTDSATPTPGDTNVSPSPARTPTETTTPSPTQTSLAPTQSSTDEPPPSPSPTSASTTATPTASPSASPPSPSPTRSPRMPATASELVVVYRDQGGQLATRVQPPVAGKSLPSSIAAVSAEAAVVSVAPDVTGELLGASLPNDSSFKRGAQQPSAYALGLCCGPTLSAWYQAGWGYPPAADVTVAILDTGIAPLNPELTGAIAPGWNAASKQEIEPATTLDTAPSETSRHGTKVASLIAANRNNAKSIAGLATINPDGSAFRSVAKVAPYVVTENNAKKVPVPKLSYVSDALTRIASLPAAQKPPVVVLPLAFPSAAADEAARLILLPTIGALADQGVLVVAAARAVEGAPNLVAAPASLPGAMAVGGWSQAAANGHFPRTVPGGNSVDLVGPAQGVTVAYRNPSFTSGWSKDSTTDGQSYAAAAVAGIAAVRAAVTNASCPTSADPRKCLNQLVTAVTQSATPIMTKQQPIQRVDASYQGAGMASLPLAVELPADYVEALALPVPVIAAQAQAGAGGSANIKVTVNWQPPDAGEYRVRIVTFNGKSKDPKWQSWHDWPAGQTQQTITVTVPATAEVADWSIRAAAKSATRGSSVPSAGLTCRVEQGMGVSQCQ